MEGGRRDLVAAGWDLQGLVCLMYTSWDIPSEYTLASQTARTSSLPGYQQDEKPCGEKDPGEERVVEIEPQLPAPSQAFKWDHQGVI